MGPDISQVVVEPRFYYWIEGGEVQGPVTKDELRQLFNAQAIGSATQLCREGENEWRPLDRQDLEAVQVSAPVAAPVEMQPQSPPVTDNPEESPLQVILKTACYLITFGGALALTLVQHWNDKSANPVESIGGQIGSFIAGLLIIGAFPFLVSLAVPRSFRLWVRAIGMLMLVSFIFRGYFSGEPTSDRINRDLVPVSKELNRLGQIAMDTRKAEGSFDPATLSSLQDIAARRDKIVKMRNAQMEFATYMEKFDEHCRSALANDSIDPETETKAIGDFKTQAHLDYVLTQYKLRIQLSDDMLAIADFLDAHFGRWSVQNGAIVFDDDGDAKGYEALLDANSKDVKEITDLKSPFDSEPPSK